MEEIFRNGAEIVSFCEELWKKSRDAGGWVWVWSSHCSTPKYASVVSSQVNALQFSRFELIPPPTLTFPLGTSFSAPSMCTNDPNKKALMMDGAHLIG